MTALLLSLALVVFLPVVNPSGLGGGFLHTVAAVLFLFGEQTNRDYKADRQDNKLLHGSELINKINKFIK